MSGRDTPILREDLRPPLPQPPIEVLVENHGSLFLLRPLDDTARDWLWEHTADDALEFGGALVVEPRYVSNIVEGLRAAGFVVR